MVNQKGMKGCGECEHVPCDVWRKTKDSAFTEEEFERNIQERVKNLKTPLEKLWELYSGYGTINIAEIFSRG